MCIEPAERPFPSASSSSFVGSGSSGTSWLGSTSVAVLMMATVRCSARRRPHSRALVLACCAAPKKGAQAESPQANVHHLLQSGQAAMADWKALLLSAGEKQPLWYRTADTVLTVVAATCFVIATAMPDFSLLGRGSPEASQAVIHALRSIEDVINVIFLVGYLLMFWANDFRIEWFFKTSSILDLVSCLPVLSIGIRSPGSDIAAYVQFLQLPRFLRLLRETRLLTKSNPEVPPGADTAALTLAFFGSIAVSATVLFLYERDVNDNVDTIVDTLVYMTTVFTGRPPPFAVASDRGKVVAAVSCVLALVAIPFFVSEITAVAMSSMSRGQSSEGGLNLLQAWQPQSQPRMMESSEFWAKGLRAIDRLCSMGKLSPGLAKELRLRCYEESPGVAMVIRAYDTEEIAEELLAARLAEYLEHQQKFGFTASMMPVTDDLTDVSSTVSPGLSEVGSSQHL